MEFTTYILLFVLLLHTRLISTQLTTGNSPSTVLQNVQSFSTFNRLLTQTGVISEINSRSSLTLLLPQNAVVEAFLSRNSNPSVPLVADVLRYHCLLQYLEVSQIQSMTNELGMLVTTLYQTTGRAAGQNGFVNVSISDAAVRVGLPFTEGFNATMVRNVTQFPYNISYIEIDHVLVPVDLGRPQAAASSILNFTNSLQRAGRFNTFVSLMQTTGLTASLAGLSSYTVFVPTDEAFQALPAGTMQALSPDQASKLMAYHVLNSYANFDVLQRQNSWVQTLASNGDNKRFLVQVVGGNGGVSLSTQVDTAQLISSVYDQSPAAGYSVNRVLLPPEIFVVSGAPAVSPGVGAPIIGGVPPVLSPAVSPVMAPPPSEQQGDAGQAPVEVTPGPALNVGSLPPASGPGETSPSSALTRLVLSPVVSLLVIVSALVV